MNEPDKLDAMRKRCLDMINESFKEAEMSDKHSDCTAQAFADFMDARRNEVIFSTGPVDFGGWPDKFVEMIEQAFPGCKCFVDIFHNKRAVRIDLDVDGKIYYFEFLTGYYPWDDHGDERGQGYHERNVMRFAPWIMAQMTFCLREDGPIRLGAGQEASQ